MVKNKINKYFLKNRCHLWVRGLPKVSLHSSWAWARLQGKHSTAGWPKRSIGMNWPPSHHSLPGLHRLPRLPARDPSARATPHLCGEDGWLPQPAQGSWPWLLPKPPTWCVVCWVHLLASSLMQKKVGEIAHHAIWLDLPRVTLSMNIVGLIFSSREIWFRKVSKRSQRNWRLNGSSATYYLSTFSNFSFLYLQKG